MANDRRGAAASTSPATVVRVSAHYVYVVRCADGSLYTGYARDPVARAAVHNRGKGAHYTASRRPVVSRNGYSSVSGSTGGSC